MTGEMDLVRMLATLEPVLDPRRFAFSTHAGMDIASAAAHAPVGVFQESEGLTLITEARAGDTPRFAMISLSVHSNLEAVGLTAAIATALTQHGISANVVAAYFHDHIFVAEADAKRAMTVLHDLAAQHRAPTLTD